jgi:hypothetical protein
MVTYKGSKVFFADSESRLPYHISSVGRSADSRLLQCRFVMPSKPAVKPACGRKESPFWNLDEDGFVQELAVFQTRHSVLYFVKLQKIFLGLLDGVQRQFHRGIDEIHFSFFSRLESGLSSVS